MSLCDLCIFSKTSAHSFTINNWGLVAHISVLFIFNFYFCLAAFRLGCQLYALWLFCNRYSVKSFLFSCFTYIILCNRFSVECCSNFKQISLYGFYFTGNIRIRICMYMKFYLKILHYIRKCVFWSTYVYMLHCWFRENVCTSHNPIFMQWICNTEMQFSVFILICTYICTLLKTQ